MKKLLLGLILSLVLIASFTPAITNAEEHPKPNSIEKLKLPS